MNPVSPILPASTLTLAASLLALVSPLLAQKVDFEQQVWPILEKNCIECHQAPYTDASGRTKRPKGKVELDSAQGIKQSKGGKLFVPKKHSESMVYETITLPEDDEDRMPPPKKGPPLTKQQIELIQRWIDEGASFGKWTGKKPDTKEATGGGTSAKKGGKGREESPLLTLQKGLTPLPATTLAAFAEGPFQVQSVGEDNPLLRVSCSGRTDEVDDQALESLTPLLDHVTELDLGRSRVGDAGCQVIARMPRLTFLDLRQCRVANQGVAALAACKELRSLNLFGTKTGDYALAALESLSHLQHLYVWQTDVTANGAVRLRERLPELHLVFTADLPEPMEGDGGGNRRRR